LHGADGRAISRPAAHAQPSAWAGGERRNQMRSRTLVGCGLVLAIVLLALSGCDGNGCHREGPAERAGKKVDEAVEQTGDAMKDAGDKANTAVEDTKEQLEDAVE
jgi:hypothetical protein